MKAILKIIPLSVAVLYMTFPSPVMASVAEGVVAYEAKDYGKALAEFRAQSNDPVAQRYLGYIYQKGFGVEKDYQAGVDWMRKAASQGDTLAMINLGNVYYYGYLGRSNHRTAFEWFKKAADQGDKYGQAWLAELYAFGQGTGRNPQLAMQSAIKSYEQGNAQAAMMLGGMYLPGSIYSDAQFQKNLKIALDWYRKAVEMDSEDAAAALAQVLSRKYKIEQIPPSKEAQIQWIDRLAGTIERQEEAQRLARQESDARRVIEMEKQREAEKNRRDDYAKAVRVIGAKACTWMNATERRAIGVALGQTVYGEPIMQKYLVTAFTEDAAGAKLKLRIAGVQKSTAGTLSNVEKLDGDIVIQTGAIIWDDAVGWQPCDRMTKSLATW